MDDGFDADADADDDDDDGERKGAFIHSAHMRDLNAGFSVQKGEKTKLIIRCQ